MKRAKQPSKLVSKTAGLWPAIPLAVATFALGVALAALWKAPPSDEAPRSVDNLQAVVMQMPAISLRRQRYEAAAEHDVIFINGGNRAAAIVSMQLVMVDLLEDGTSCENFPEKTMGAVYLNYELGPLTIPAGEIVSRKVKLRKVNPQQSALAPMFQPQDSKSTKVLACYRFAAVAAGVRQETAIFAGLWTFNRTGTAYIDNADTGVPFVLIGPTSPARH